MEIIETVFLLVQTQSCKACHKVCLGIWGVVQRSAIWHSWAGKGFKKQKHKDWIVFLVQVCSKEVAQFRQMCGHQRSYSWSLAQEKGPDHRSASDTLYKVLGILTWNRKCIKTSLQIPGSQWFGNWLHMLHSVFPGLTNFILFRLLQKVLTFSWTNSFSLFSANSFLSFQIQFTWILPRNLSLA